EHEAFTVVGLSYHGRNQQGEIATLWNSVRDEREALRPLAATDAWYGVSFGGDPETGEFDYVAGVRVDQDSEVPDPFTGVDVPAATYLQVETTLGTIDETMEAVHGQWLADSAYELSMGPEFERYGQAFDHADADAPFEVFVPVEGPE
ncbi:MAG: GyrI-like domain-containing protein, partial [Halodesulfurarchaeum sp.]